MKCDMLYNVLNVLNNFLNKFFCLFFSIVKNGKRVKEHITVNGYSISQLRDVSCHMGSHSVTCHPTQVNAPHLNPSQ